MTDEAVLAESLLDRLNRLVSLLLIANQDLLRCPEGEIPQRLPAILEERDRVLAEWRDQIEKTASFLEVPAGGRSANAVVMEWLHQRLAAAPDPTRMKLEELQRALGRLAASDETISKTLNDRLASLRRELGQTRQGNRVLKGYSRLDIIDSCFIDRRR